ncbi:MAG: hypothetical protein Q8K59_12255 [Nitrosomonas sp.]|nr:hypothetical protein [Nitrosomonas sp.]MDP1951837.1 hypothetical protein [Nitrosomonas sp.]
MKALFFLRHYNDIDHITPVVFKWIESGHVCDIVLVGSSKFLSDYRIEFLGKLAGVRVAHIRDLLPPLVFLRWRLQTLLLAPGLRRLFIGPLANALAQIYNAKKREYAWRNVTHHVLTRSFENVGKGVVIFDWITRNSPVCIEWVETVVSMARTLGLGTVSLPHGDSPHANQLIRRHEWKLQPDPMYSAGRIFDKLVVPNELCAVRFRPFMDDRSLAVLGSPRFCDEWLSILAKLSPPSPLIRSDSRLKLVIFLRKSDFTTFWEEVGEVVQMIAAFPGVELVIKPHTRGGWRQSLTNDTLLRRLPNVSVAGDDVHSIHLMNWADVVIDLATSVVFEAVKERKPVLAADYLHAGRSTIAEFMPETRLRCRDDVYQRIDEFLTIGCDSFYIEKHRQHFLKEMIDGPDADVLPRYVALLEAQGEASFYSKARILKA